MPFLDEDNSLAMTSDKEKAISKQKLSKAIATLALAFALALTPLSLIACFSTSNPENADPSVVDQDKPNLSQCSQILQNVLNSDYYNNIIDEYNIERWYSDNRALGIPYRFLESEGFDVASIKNNKIQCTSTAYVMNNDTKTLYLSVKTKIPNGNKNFYSCYKLKYSLTDKEYKDLYMLHKGNYIQAPFFIQELSKTKTPTVMSNVKVDTTTYDQLEEFMNTIRPYPNLLNGYFGIDFVKIADVKHITVECRTNPNYSNMLSENCRLRTIDLLVYDTSRPALTNNIYSIKTINNTALIPTNSEDFESKYSTITYFYTDNVNHVNTTLKA